MAVTLAGAAEGMIQREGPHMFAHLRDSPRVEEKMSKKEWIATLNRELYWLKHGGQNEMAIECADAAFLITRAASKLEKWTPKMKLGALAHVASVKQNGKHISVGVVSQNDFPRAAAKLDLIATDLVELSGRCEVKVNLSTSWRLNAPAGIPDLDAAIQEDLKAASDIANKNTEK